MTSTWRDGGTWWWSPRTASWPAAWNGTGTRSSRRSTAWNESTLRIPRPDSLVVNKEERVRILALAQDVPLDMAELQEGTGFSTVSIDHVVCLRSASTAAFQ